MELRKRGPRETILRAKRLSPSRAESLVIVVVMDTVEAIFAPIKLRPPMV
jgi:hypothetical protein